eukprot:3068023-Lingulodinium_polyedra.AAC.1
MPPNVRLYTACPPKTSNVATQTRPPRRGCFPQAAMPLNGAQLTAAFTGPPAPRRPLRPTCEALGGVRLRRVLSVLAPETAPATRHAIRVGPPERRRR